MFKQKWCKRYMQSTTQKWTTSKKDSILWTYITSLMYLSKIDLFFFRLDFSYSVRKCSTFLNVFTTSFVNF